MNSEKEIPQDVIQLVVTRLESMPRNMTISIGALDGIGGSYSVEELIKRGRQQDAVGRQMIDVQMSYLRSLDRRSAPPATAVA